MQIIVMRNNSRQALEERNELVIAIIAWEVRCNSLHMTNIPLYRFNCIIQIGWLILAPGDVPYVHVRVIRETNKGTLQIAQLEAGFPQFLQGPVTFISQNSCCVFTPCFIPQTRVGLLVNFLERDIHICLYGSFSQ